MTKSLLAHSRPTVASAVMFVILSQVNPGRCGIPDSMGTGHASINYHETQWWTAVPIVGFLLLMLLRGWLRRNRSEDSDSDKTTSGEVQHAGHSREAAKETSAV
ncbi:hypothetical protein P389DRAFT_172099 [Cystobasidium minutum MCA 4210]|uniref:uncharacterized protein n=1 Tax=Cystobasidium minutum MCA 4210 TaxID=1397322 RepID=UPI0034CE9434|eukprot:jgi/Rhomi1/172099/fgenesh1_kg.4_\